MTARHVGLPVDEDDARARAALGLPVYRPSHPRDLDQDVADAYAAAGMTLAEVLATQQDNEEATRARR